MGFIIYQLITCPPPLYIWYNQVSSSHGWACYISNMLGKRLCVSASNPMDTVKKNRFWKPDHQPVECWDATDGNSSKPMAFTSKFAPSLVFGHAFLLQVIRPARTVKSKACAVLWGFLFWLPVERATRELPKWFFIWMGLKVFEIRLKCCCDTSSCLDRCCIGNTRNPKLGGDSGVLDGSISGCQKIYQWLATFSLEPS